MTQNKKTVAMSKATRSKKKQPLAMGNDPQQPQEESKLMELAQSRAELEAAYRQYTDLYDFAPVGYFTLARNGTIHQVNLAGANLLGMDHNEATRLHLAAFISRESPPTFKVFFEKLLSGEGKETCELAFEKRGNELIWACLEATCFEGGDISRAMLTDITERKRMEQALQESENRFRTLLEDVSTIAVQGYAMDGTTQYWNTASEKLYGYSAQEAIGQSLLELIIPPEMRKNVWHAIHQMGETGEPIPAAELSLMRKDGSRVAVYSSHAIVSVPGRAPELFCLDVDLTEHKRLASLAQARVRTSEFADLHTFDELLQKMLDEAEALTGSQLGFAHFLDADQKTLQLQMWSTNTLKKFCSAEGKGSHYQVDQAGVWADCISARAPLIHNDYATLPNRKGLPQGHALIMRELVVPVLRNDLIVMIVGVGNKSTDYDDNDVKTLSQLASLAWDIVQRKQAEEALRESEEKYRRLFDNAILGIFQSTPEGKAISVNNAFAHMFGYDSPEDAIKRIGNVGVDIFSDPNRRAEILHLMSENPDLRTFENLYRRRDGSTFLGSLNTMPIRDPDGSLIRIEGIIEDITERKQTEKALRESQQLFSLFMYHSPIYAFIKEVTPTESRILQASENYLNMIGITGRDMIGKTMAELFPPEFAAKFTADDWSVITSGEVLKLDEDMNGRHYTTIKFPIIQGDKTLLAGYTIDITERVEAETALKESEFFVKGVLNSLTAHIAVLDGQGQIIAVNESWKNFAHENGSHDSADYVGSNYLDACQAAIQQGDPIARQVDQGIRAVLDGSQSQFSIEYPCHAPGRQCWFTVTILPRHKSSQGLVVLHQDITERKQADVELQYMKDGLEKANRELHTALAREQQLAHTDALTGINNRRHLFELAEHEFEIAVRYQQPLAVVMFDIDHFKDVNDTFGHAVGDKILQQVTKVACAELRSADVIGRYGGEEFVIILPMTNAQRAHSLAERIRVGVRAIRVPTEKGDASITLSIGIVEIHHGAQAGSIENMIRDADKVMYTAKQAGRNQTKIGVD